jgi:alanyl-tRNA synthetase
LVTGVCQPNALGVKFLREFSERTLQKIKSGVLIVGMKDAEDEKVMLLASVSPDLTSRINASNILKEIAPIVDGRGGGKPEMAQAGGTKVAELPQAVEKGKALARDLLSQKR